MRISVKGRYAIISMLILAEKYESDAAVTAGSIAEAFKISKIYLEQVFALLKRGSLVTSTVGSQGGYKLAESPDKITLFDILGSIELSLFEKTNKTLEDEFGNFESTMNQCVYDPLDHAVRNALTNVTLADLSKEYGKNNPERDYMYYI